MARLNASMAGLSRQVPDEDEVAGWIAGALRRHGLAAAHIVAHSYGTFMASRRAWECLRYKWLL